MKRILITGAARRIGEIIALYLAEKLQNDEIFIVVHYRTSKLEAEAVCQKIRELGANAALLAADLSNTKTVNEIIPQAAILSGGPINVLINNASIFEYDQANNIDVKIANRAMAVNHLAPTILAQETVNQFTDDDLGDEFPVIINILDQKLWNYNPDFYSYTASKAALLASTKMMFQAFADRARICGIAPGILLPSFGQTQAEFIQVASKNLMEKPINPKEVAIACAFIIETDHVHGQIFHIDNGQHQVPSERDVMYAD